MAGMTNCTAGLIKAILCFIDPENTPKIAATDDSLAEPLIKKLKESIGDKDGSQPIYVHWSREEWKLEKEFHLVLKNVQSVVNGIVHCTKHAAEYTD